MPRVWGLLGHRLGDNQQVIAVAEALGWPYVVKQLHYGRGSRIPNFLRRMRPLGIRVDPETPIEAPWPDLVIAVGYRSVPLALSIREASGGRCRLLQIGRPRAPLRWFDLILTTPQYELPAAANVVELPLPFSRRPGGEGTGATDPTLLAELESLPRPHRTVLIGGPTKEIGFEPADARVLASQLSERIRVHGGSLLVTTSPRTPPEVSAELARALPEASRLQIWHPGTANPYPTYLATADEIIVTSDSVSMLADACRSGAPVSLFQLPPRHSWRRRLDALVEPLTRRRHALLALGVAVSRRQYEAVHEALRSQGLLGDDPPLDKALDVATRATRRAVCAAWEEQALARVRALLQPR